MASYWYRVEDGRYAPTLDEWERPMGNGRAWVRLVELLVLKETQCGVWLAAHGGRRFVLRDARKRYACPTPEEARESWRARKKQQLRILEAKMRHVCEALALEVET